MYYDKKQKILIATPNPDTYKILFKIFKDNYYINPSYNGYMTLKYIFNNRFNLVFLDSLFHKEIRSTTILSLCKDCNKTAKVPLLLIKYKKDKILFENISDINVKSNKNYTFKNIKSLVDSIILPNYIFSEPEDVQNFTKSLIYALESKDVYSKNHSARVSKLAYFIGSILKLPAKECELLGEAGLFHDIGKIGIADKVLLKPAKLSDEEFNIIKEHPVLSEKICSPIQAFNPFIPIIRNHHERVDGKGYPDKLKGDDIPLGARIVAVADAFDALTSNRAYRVAFSIDKVTNILKDGAGSQWDKRIIDEFLKYFNEEKMKELLSTSNPFDTNLIKGTIFENKKEERN